MVEMRDHSRPASVRIVWQHLRTRLSGLSISTETPAISLALSYFDPRKIEYLMNPSIRERQGAVILLLIRHDG